MARLIWGSFFVIAVITVANKIHCLRMRRNRCDVITKHFVIGKTRTPGGEKLIFHIFIDPLQQPGDVLAAQFAFKRDLMIFGPRRTMGQRSSGMANIIRKRQQLFPILRKLPFSKYRATRFRWRRAQRAMVGPIVRTEG